MLDLWIVGIFLAATLVIGIWQGRGITNLSIFSIAERKYGTTILVATITATFLDGSDTFGNSEITFSYGLIFITVAMGNVLYSLILSKIIAPNIDKYKGCISIGDMIKVSYGKKAQLLTGIAGALKDITSLGAQASALGYTFHYFLNIPHSYGIFIGIGIIIIYSVFGGMKAVTVTDILQFAVLMVAIPMICNMGLHQIGGYEIFFKEASNINFDVTEKQLIKHTEIFLIFTLSIIGPTSAQRLLMAKDSVQANKAFYYSAIICAILYLLIGIMGVSARILKPDLNPVLAMPYIIQLLPIGLKGFAIAGLLAIIMSTADSLLNSTSVLFVNDIIEPVLNRSLKEDSKLKIARYATFFIGIFSVLAAISFQSVLDIMVFSHIFWTPVIVAPFFLAAVGVRLDRRAFWVGTIAATSTLIFWKVLNLEKAVQLSGTLPAMFIDFTFIMACHYYYKICRPDRFEPTPNLIANELKRASKISDQ